MVECWFSSNMYILSLFTDTKKCKICNTGVIFIVCLHKNSECALFV